MKMKTHYQDWLEEHGYKLGYNWEDRKPELEDLDRIAEEKYKAIHYFDSHLRTLQIEFLTLTGRI